MSFHARRFDRAARSYGEHAEVQDAMGAALVGLLPGTSGDPARVLEFGCGTGRFTRRLRERFPGAALLATDAAPRMLEETARTLAGAGSGSPAPALALCDASGDPALAAAARSAAPFGLAASNALVQWFPDLRAHFRLAASLLEPGGLYLVSGFLRTNFSELNALLAAEPFGYRDFPGHSLEEVAAAAAGPFAVETLRTEDLPRAYPAAADFLGVIKGLGSARRPADRRPLTRERLDLLLRRYQEGYALPGGGVAATWRPWYALLRRA